MRIIYSVLAIGVCSLLVSTPCFAEWQPEKIIADGNDWSSPELDPSVPEPNRSATGVATPLNGANSNFGLTVTAYASVPLPPRPGETVPELPESPDDELEEDSIFAGEVAGASANWNRRLIQVFVWRNGGQSSTSFDIVISKDYSLSASVNAVGNRVDGTATSSGWGETNQATKANPNPPTKERGILDPIKENAVVNRDPIDEVHAEYHFAISASASASASNTRRGLSASANAGASVGINISVGRI